MKSWMCAWYRPLNLWGWLQNEAERFRIVARWLPVVWHDADFDHNYLWRVMEHKFRRMAHYAKKHGHLVSSKRQARELRVAAALCRRLYQEDYVFVQGAAPLRIAKPFGAENHFRAGIALSAAQRDLNYLTHFMRRKALGWWD